METFEDQRSENLDEDTATAAAAYEAVPPIAEVSTDDFISRAVADPALVRFLGMRILTPATVTAFRHGERGKHSVIGGRGGGGVSITLREALRGLAVTTGGGAGPKGVRSKAKTIGVSAGQVQWDDVEGLLFEPYDPTELLGNPPCTVSVSSRSVPAGAAGAQHEEEEVCSSIRVGGQFFSASLLLHGVVCYVATCCCNLGYGVAWGLPSSQWLPTICVLH